MNSLPQPTEQPPRPASLWFALRLALAALLLLPAAWFSWQTVAGLNARRQLRAEQAELDHVRYGMLDTDRWRAIIGPILDEQINKLDLKTQSKNLRPMVERSLNELLDNIKKQMTAPAPTKGAAAGAGGAKAPSGAGGLHLPGPANAMLVNMMVASLRPHVPEYATVVLAELAKPANQAAFKESIRGVMQEGVRNSFGAVDMTAYNAILKRRGCSTAGECEEKLGNQIADDDRKLNRDTVMVLVSAALGFALLAFGRRKLSRPAVLVLMLFSIVMLLGGVLSPMLEVEVRITKLDATLMGHTVEFQDQSLYYRSKTVLEVFKTLMEMHRPAMTLVAVLVLLFSVIFPALKMAALSACLFRPRLLRNGVVRIFAFELSKWSMADVMVLAIFMSFVAFNGVIASGMGGVRAEPAVQQLVIPTNASEILPGYYLFIGFCVASIFLSKKLERGIGTEAAS